MSRLHGQNLKKVILLFLNYCSLQIWTLKICINDSSKIIIARSFKLGQLIEDDKKITWWKSKKNIFPNYCPFQIWTLKICNEDISKTIIARSF